MAYEPTLTLTPEILTMCTSIGEMVGLIAPTSELNVNPHLHRKLRISTIHSSLAIEQNSLTEDQVTAILEGKRVVGPSEDIREVENANRAYALIEELDPYSIDDLLRAHGAMMEGLRPDAGMLRSRNVGIYAGTELVHAGTPAAYVPQVLGELFDWLAKTDLHPLVASCVFHADFEYIHPFSDGNGRTGRLWQTLLLSHWRPVLAWVPVETIIRKRQQEYYEALNASDTQGDTAVFVTLMLDIIKEAIEPFVVPSKREAREAQVLLMLANHPDLTAAKLAERFFVTKRTMERTLSNLQEQGRLVREGSKRYGTWRVLG